jgi:hypothetical protein
VQVVPDQAHDPVPGELRVAVTAAVGTHLDPALVIPATVELHDKSCVGIDGVGHDGGHFLVTTIPRTLVDLPVGPVKETMCLSPAAP